MRPITNRMLVAVAAALGSACAQSDREPELALAATSDAVIRWGTSFGMCAGYCYEDLEIDGSTIRLTRRSWNPMQAPQVEEQTFSQEAWRALLQGLSTARIDGLQDVYGCPDCADGGAEWVELESTEGRKRVTFEYGSGPEPLQAVLTELRALRKRFPSD